MYIKSKELEILLEIENYLWNNNLSVDLYIKIHELNTNLIERKRQYNERNSQAIALKRKMNKMYARSKKKKRGKGNESKKQ